jgi:uncharacterized membrane protein required for colicin V production
MEMIINLIIVALTLLLAYALTSEGLWGSALMFFNVLFGAMIAFNFYEPLAVLLDRTGINWGFSDTLCMLGLFCVSVLLLRMTTETIAPTMVRFPTPIYHAGRLIFGLAGAAVTMAVIILAFHAAPVNKKIFSVVKYDTKPPFGLGLDHQWLGFFQYQTGAVFARFGVGRPDPYRQYGQGGAVEVFDPLANWLILHQQARPYESEGGALLSEEGAGAAGAAAAGAGEAGQAPPGPPGQGRGRGGPGGRGGAPP